MDWPIKFPFDYPYTQTNLETIKYNRPYYLPKPINEHLYRDSHIVRFGYALVTKEELDLIKPLLEGKKVIEVGCGTGYVTHALRSMGSVVDALDDGKGGMFEWIHYLDDIIKEDYSTADLSNYDVIIVCWPSYGYENVTLMLNSLKSGTVVIYEGEMSGGCCAPDSFFDLIDERCAVDELTTNKLNDLHWRFTGSHDEWLVFQVN